MSPLIEKRLLQGAVALACIVPLSAGGAGAVRSAAMLKGVAAPLPPDLDSHYRYLSGLLLGIGLVFLLSLRRIEHRGAVFRTLGAVIVVGGLARLLPLLGGQTPSGAHVFALAMELGVVPIIMLWQARIERLVK